MWKTFSIERPGCSIRPGLRNGWICSPMMRFIGYLPAKMTSIRVGMCRSFTMTRRRWRPEIKRLRSGFAFSQDPASRVHRLISNVEVTGPEEGSSIFEVNCMMLLVELARKRQTIHTARCEFTLDRSTTTWRIRRKKVNLLRNGEVLESTPFLI